MTSLQLLSDALRPDSLLTSAKYLTERMRGETGDARQETFGEIAALTELRSLLGNRKGIPAPVIRANGPDQRRFR